MPRKVSVRIAIAGATLLISALLIFWQLGHYALWDDEAYTALHAKGVLATGDTTAVIGDNIVAFRGGLLLSHLKDHTTPPAQVYLTAISMGLFGDSAFAARLPFALAGLGCIALMLWWLWKATLDVRWWIIFSLGIVGNVSLILYSRNCRYYALSMLFSTLIAYLYLHHDGRRRSIILLSAASIGLLASNYLHFAAIFVALAVDYAIWGRRLRWIGWREWALFLAPIVALGLPIVLIWNPLTGNLGSYSASNTFRQRIELIWMNVRDLNRCQFAPVLLLAIAPFLYFFTRNIWLLRGPVAAGCFIVVISMASPQTLPKDVSISLIDADVRYLVPIIPLGIAISAMALVSLAGKWRCVAVAIAVPIYLTNALNQFTRLDWHVSSALWQYLGELRNSPPDPYSVTAGWINRHVEPKQSIWVVPTIAQEHAGYQAYPLMFHAPQAIYAWQLEYPPADQFKDLPEIHFFDRALPDYIIAFGPIVGELIKNFHPKGGAAYELNDILDTFWKDAYRPEIMWRSFRRIPADKEHGTAIYIFKKRLTGTPGVPSPNPPSESRPAPRSDFHL